MPAGPGARGSVSAPGAAPGRHRGLHRPRDARRAPVRAAGRGRRGEQPRRGAHRGGERRRRPRQDHARRARGAPGPRGVPRRPALRGPARGERAAGRARARCSPGSCAISAWRATRSRRRDDERAALYRTRLTGRRVLILLDNAKDAAQVRPLLPGSSSCAVLVTTRNRTSGPGKHPVRRPERARGHRGAGAVLPDRGRGAGRGRAGRHRRGARRLRRAAARHQDLRGPARGAQAVADRHAGGPAAQRAPSPGRAEHRRSRGPGVASRSATTACRRPAGGVDPARVFRLLGLWQGLWISQAAAAALVGAPEDDIADALETLVDANLLESPAPDWYRFHDLLRVYATERAQAEESEATQARGGRQAAAVVPGHRRSRRRHRLAAPLPGSPRTGGEGTRTLPLRQRGRGPGLVRR